MPLACVFEGRHRLGVLIEPGHELGMSGTPFAFVPEIEIAEGTGKREMAVIWGRRSKLASSSRAGRARGRSWPAGAVARARATSLRGELLLIDQQQRGVEDAVGQ